MSLSQKTKNKIAETIRKQHKEGKVYKNMPSLLKGRKPWNKGLSRKTDPRVDKYCNILSKVLKGRKSTAIVTSEERLRRSKRMLGDKNPAKCPEVKARIAATLKQTYKDHPEILENRNVSGKNQHSDTYSSIERLIADELIKRKIVFGHNKPVGRYWADFIIGDLVVECDGWYWHKDLKEHDKKKDLGIKKLGYKILRLSESKIKKSPSKCVDRIIKIIGD